MPDNDSPRPSPLHIVFSIVVVASCVFPIGLGLEAVQLSDPPAFWMGIVLIAPFATLAFAQYVTVFRRTRHWASVAIVILVVVVMIFLPLSINSLESWTDEHTMPIWALGIAGTALIYGSVVVLNFQWQEVLNNARMQEQPLEPAKTLRLVDLFAITTFAAGLMAFLAAF